MHTFFIEILYFLTEIVGERFWGDINNNENVYEIWERIFLFRENNDRWKNVTAYGEAFEAAKKHKRVFQNICWKKKVIKSEIKCIKIMKIVKESYYFSNKLKLEIELN